MPHIPQPLSLESKSPKFGDTDPKVVACSAEMPTQEITRMMVQIMEVRSEIRKNPLFQDN
jgi:hypothetical protein